MGRGAEFMLNSFPAALTMGLILGFLSGLGIGGGSLLVLWLTAVLSMEQRAAQGINLLFFLPAALCACMFHLRRRVLPWRIILPAAISGCVFAAVGSFLAANMDTDLLRRLFGGLLILTGLSELFRKKK